MEKILSFFRKNIKIFAISCVAILFAVAGILSCCFLMPEKSGNVSAASSSYAGGNGDSGDPYIIETADQLMSIATNVNGGTESGKYYKVTKPINLSGKNWTPIGTSEKPFCGIIDFNNNPVVGMTISGAYESCGFIGAAKSTITIKNAFFMHSNITSNATTSKKYAVGELIGIINDSSAKITLENVTSNSAKITVNGSEISKYNGVGGLIGSVISCSSGSIKNTSIKSEISAKNRVYLSALGAVIGYCPYVSSLPIIGIDDAIIDAKITYNTDQTDCYGAYIGDFNGENLSDWFYIDGINGSVPALKSQYWIGKSSNKTGSEIKTQLGKVNAAYTGEKYVSKTAKDIIKNNASYVITNKVKVQNTEYESSAWKDIKVNGIARANFSMTVSSLTGANSALLGEKVTLTNTTNAGYQFSQYSVNNTKIGNPYTVTGNKTIVAEFLPITYTITYNLNGNSDARINETSKNVTFDAAVGTFAVPFSLGYTFQGWSTSSTGSTNLSDASGACKTLANYIDSNKNWVKASNITAYAIWVKNSYTLKLNANGGTLATSTESYTQQYGTSITIADPTRTGYTFAGWVATNTINGSEWAQILYHNSVAGTKLFTSSESDNLDTTAKNDVYRNAQFSMLGKLGLSEYEFLLQYDSLPEKYNQWKQTSNPATTTAVTGYSAVHIDWTANNWGGIAKSSSTASTFIDGSPSATTWFYALGAYTQWNGGVPAAASTPEKDRINLWLKTDSTLSNFKPTETFIDNDALGNNNKYYFKAEAVTLKALWIANKYEVAFDGIYPTPFTGLYTNQRDNSTWTTTNTDGVYEYAFNTGTLTAGATSSGPHLGGLISYLTNGATYRIRFSIKASQAISGLPYRFEAAKTWAQKTVNVTTSYQDCYIDFVYNETATYSHLIFYYSKMPDNATITFKNITLSKIVTYDSTYGTLPEPTRTGYTFKGWWTAASGGTQVTALTTVAITAKQTLYAHWLANRLILKYNLNATWDEGAKKYTDIEVSSAGGFSNSSLTNGVSRTEAYYYDNTYTYGITNAIDSRIIRRGFSLAGTKYYTDPACTQNPIEQDGVTTTIAIASALGVLSSLQTQYETTVNIYVKWTPKTYTLSCNSNGGSLASGSYPTSFKYSLSNQTITIPTPTRTGYTFAGWTITKSSGETINTLKDSNGKEESHEWSNDGLTLSISNGILTIPGSYVGAITLTAKWTANTYTTSVYNYQPMNGGKTWDNSERTAAGITVTPSSDAASMTLNGTMTDNITICILRGLRVKAGEQYTIKISCFGGSFERLGTGACLAFDFKRANLDSLTSRSTKSLGVLPSVGESWVSESVLTMTEQNEQEVGACTFWLWKGSAANSAGNWGYKFTNYKLRVQLIKINTLSSVSQTYDSKANKYPVPTLAGFSFDGWYLNSAANGVQLTDSSGNVMSSVDGYTDANGNWIYPNTAKVYSVWTPITYTATFNANGGSVSPSSINYTYGAFYEDLPTPTRTGYTFGGWYGNIDGYTILDYIQATGTQYIDTGVYTTSDIKVYADFQYTDVSTTQQRVFGHTFGSDTNTNVSFGTYINGNGKWAFAYQDGQGNWQASTVTATTARTYITLDGKNKTFSIRGPATYDYSITTTVTRQSDTSLTIFADHHTGNVGDYSKMKLYAFKIWKNGSLIRDYIPVKRNSDGVVGLFDLVGGLFYTNAGTGSFTAGSTSSTGTVRYDYAHKFLAANKTLTAKWTANKYTVTFDKNNGFNLSEKTREVTFDSTYTSLPTVYRRGHDFKGWFTAASGGVQVVVGSKMNIAKNHTLYAQWGEARTYSIEYRADSYGCKVSGPSTGTCGSAVTFTWEIDDSASNSFKNIWIGFGELSSDDSTYIIASEKIITHNGLKKGTSSYTYDGDYGTNYHEGLKIIIKFEDFLFMSQTNEVDVPSYAEVTFENPSNLTVGGDPVYTSSQGRYIKFKLKADVRNAFYKRRFIQVRIFGAKSTPTISDQWGPGSYKPHEFKINETGVNNSISSYNIYTVYMDTCYYSSGDCGGYIGFTAYGDVYLEFSFGEV